MSYKNRVLRLELKNKSSIGLNNLFESDLRLFAKIVEKSENLQNFDVLTIDDLDNLAKCFEQMLPVSKLNNNGFLESLDSMSEELLNHYAEALESLRDFDPTDYKAEIEKEFLRRNIKF
jgi:16S rRNA G527 N7-methylase RsmG